METFDGRPIQAGMLGGRHTGVHPEFSLAGLVAGVIVARRYRGQPGNRTQNAVEYDVRELRTGQLISNVVALQSCFGMQNGDEVVHHSTTKSLSGKRYSLTEAPASDTDGDYVLLGFIGGARESAVILGALPHGRAAYAATVEDGERRFLTHQGTSCQIAESGAFTLTRGNTTVTVAEDGKVSIVAEHIELGDPDSLRPCTGVGDQINVPLEGVNGLVATMARYFVKLPASVPIPPYDEHLLVSFVPGVVVSGSDVVKVSE